MKFLDFAKLDTLDPRAFQQTKPYPWINPAGLITADGYEALTHALPRLDQCTPVIGYQRSHGQKPHDRFVLDYHEALAIDPTWHAFVDELQSREYRQFIKRMFGRGRFRLDFHWHYAPRGASVSPHCDVARKLGSHIFYLNTPETWKPEWGGDTLILDDGGRLRPDSAPDFEQFDSEQSGCSMGNYSLLFQRQKQSWHGVRPISCPEGNYRKVFIVVINDRLREMVRTVKKRFKRGATGNG